MQQLQQQRDSGNGGTGAGDSSSSSSSSTRCNSSSSEGTSPSTTSDHAEASSTESGDENTEAARRHLTGDLLLRILSFLPPNDLALSGRLSCRDAALHFPAPHHRTAYLSQPLPPHMACESPPPSPSQVTSEPPPLPHAASGQQLLPSPSPSHAAGEPPRPPPLATNESLRPSPPPAASGQQQLPLPSPPNVAIEPPPPLPHMASESPQPPPPHVAGCDDDDPRNQSLHLHQEQQQQHPHHPQVQQQEVQMQEGAVAAARQLPFRQRLLLLSVAASSGSETNLAVAWRLLHPSLFPELLPPANTHYTRQYRPWFDPGSVAMRSGHPHLLPWLLHHRCPLDPHTTLAAAAQHCDLPGLQQTWRSLTQPPPSHATPAIQLPTVSVTPHVLEAAASSTTADTVAKLAWLLQQAGQAGGTGRASTSEQRLIGAGTWVAAARVGEVDTLRWLDEHRPLAGFDPWVSDHVVTAALCQAPLAAVRWLVEVAGCRLPPMYDPMGWEAQLAQRYPSVGGAAAGAGAGGVGGAGGARGGSGVSGLTAAFAVMVEVARRAGGGGGGGGKGRGGGKGGSAEGKLRWLRGKGTEVATASGLQHAAACGDLEAVCALLLGMPPKADAEGQQQKQQEQQQEREEVLLPAAFQAAAASGNVTIAEQLLAVSCPTGPPGTAHMLAARSGNLSMLLWLIHHPDVCPCGPNTLVDVIVGWPEAGCRGLGSANGQLLQAVRALVEQAGCPLGGGGRRGGRAFYWALKRGDVELVEYLYGKGGWELEYDTLYQAAEASCEGLVRWLVARGCPGVERVQVDPYPWPGSCGDRGTLACLRELGVPYSVHVLAEAADPACPLPVLQWLVAAGARVDAQAVARAVEAWGRRGPEVVAWLRGLCAGDEREEEGAGAG